MNSMEIGDLPLESGRILEGATVAYEMLGTISSPADNVILVLHGYTSGPDTILPVGDELEGSWQGLVGPGKAIDTDRFIVICPNALGSTYGSTGPSSIEPRTGTAYGSNFPQVAMRDVVASQKRLLDALGIDRLVAVVGASFGGLQALQWAVDYPTMMRGIVTALSSVGRPPVDVDRVRAGLARDPAWNGGDYYGHGNLTETLIAMRVAMLKGYGVDRALARTVADAHRREAMLLERARTWAETFDANSLVSIMQTMATFDVSHQLHQIGARLLYVLSRTDAFFPPALADDAMARFRKAGVQARYFEIDSENGHSASSADSRLWAPVMKAFVESL